MRVKISQQMEYLPLVWLLAIEKSFTVDHLSISNTHEYLEIAL
jgi:hypothetical protein